MQGLFAGPTGTVYGADGEKWQGHEWEGIAIPSWPLMSEHPTRWRWRLYDQIRGEEGQGRARGPIGGGADILGLGRAGVEGALVRAVAIGDPGVDTLVIVEGEPDWWSAVQAVDGRAAVIAVCASPHEWRKTWPSWAAMAKLGIRNVFVCVHHGKRNAEGFGHGEILAAAIAAECVPYDLTVLRKLAAEGYDLNDRHRDGQLGAWLQDLFDVATGDPA